MVSRLAGTDSESGRRRDIARNDGCPLRPSAQSISVYRVRATNGPKPHGGRIAADQVARPDVVATAASFSSGIIVVSRLGPGLMSTNQPGLQTALVIRFQPSGPIRPYNGAPLRFSSQNLAYSLPRTPALHCTPRSVHRVKWFRIDRVRRIQVAAACRGTRWRSRKRRALHERTVAENDRNG